MNVFFVYKSIIERVDKTMSNRDDDENNESLFEQLFDTSSEKVDDSIKSIRNSKT